MTLAEQLIEALGGRWYGSYGAARCIVHDDRSPSLIIRDGDKPGTPLVHCYAGCASRAILDELRKRRILDGPSSSSPAPASRRAPLEDAAARERRIIAARRIWDASRTIEGTLGAAYLRARGITSGAPRTLRFHRALHHGPSDSFLPAMVAAVAAPDGSFAGVHRTYLAADTPRKAEVENPKLSLGPISRGAVRLAPATAEIAVSEGIETGLAFMQAEEVPTWAALSTSGMRSVVLPPYPLATIVYLVVDRDAPGEAAADAAARRFAAEGRAVKLARPRVGKDMNDSLRAFDAS